MPGRLGRRSRRRVYSWDCRPWECRHRSRRQPAAEDRSRRSAGLLGWSVLLGTVPHGLVGTFRLLDLVGDLVLPGLRGERRVGGEQLTPRVGALTHVALLPRGVRATRSAGRVDRLRLGHVEVRSVRVQLLLLLVLVLVRHAGHLVMGRRPVQSRRSFSSAIGFGRGSPTVRSTFCSAACRHPVLGAPLDSSSSSSRSSWSSGWDTSVASHSAGEVSSCPSVRPRAVPLVPVPSTRSAASSPAGRTRSLLMPRSPARPSGPPLFGFEVRLSTSSASGPGSPSGVPGAGITCGPSGVLEGSTFGSGAWLGSVLGSVLMAGSFLR